MNEDRPADANVPNGTLDLEALVDSLKERAADRRLTVDALAQSPEFALPEERAERLARFEQAVLIEAGFHVSPSNRPLVGRLITKAKRLLTRAGWEANAHLATQTTLFNAQTAGYILELERELATLKQALESQALRITALEAEHTGRNEGAT